MMKAVTSSRNLSTATRWLMSVGIILALSSLQSSWAAFASICQAVSEAEACGCGHTCAPTGAMHHKSMSRDGGRYGMHSALVDGDNDAPRSSDASCCRALPQSDGPIVTSSAQQTVVEIRDSPLIHSVAPVRLASTRTHDPPTALARYLTNSCLLI